MLNIDIENILNNNKLNGSVVFIFILHVHPGGLALCTSQSTSSHVIGTHYQPTIPAALG